MQLFAEKLKYYINNNFLQIWVSPDATPSGRRPHHGAKELVKFDDLDELSIPLNDIFPSIHLFVTLLINPL